MADTTSPVGSTYTKYSYEEYLAQSRSPVQNLGKNEFMKLLAAQLQYQDPMEPMKDSDFVAQLAQFSSLESLESLNATMTAFQSYSLAGKYVYAKARIDGVDMEIAGVVDRVVQKDGETYVQVGDYLFKASAISEVYDSNLFSSKNPLLDSAHLIGRSVKARVYDEDGEVVEVSGVVSRIAVENGEMTAYLDSGEKVPILNIFDIQQ